MIQDGFVRYVKPVEILYWIPHGILENYPKNNIIFYKGHFPLGLYIFKEGSISIEYVSDRKSNHIIIREPTMLALNHILDSSTNKYTVKTLEPSQLIFLSRNVFNSTALKKASLCHK